MRTGNGHSFSCVFCGGARNDCGKEVDFTVRGDRSRLQIAIQRALKPRSRKREILFDSALADRDDRSDRAATEAFHVAHPRNFRRARIVASELLKRRRKPKLSRVLLGVMFREFACHKGQRHRRAPVAAFERLSRASVVDENLIARLMDSAEEMPPCVPRKRRTATDAKKNLIHEHGRMHVGFVDSKRFLARDCRSRDGSNLDINLCPSTLCSNSIPRERLVQKRSKGRSRHMCRLAHGGEIVKSFVLRLRRER